jgi:hypothetical protein
MRSITFAICAAALHAQVIPLAPGDVVSGSGGYPRINANIAYLDSKHLIGTGAPTGVVPCSVSQNLGFFYMRIDAGAAFASFYVCTKTSGSGYAWEGPYGAGGGGGSGNMLGSNNLSELTSPVIARSNLGLGTIATFSSAAFEPAIPLGGNGQYIRGNKTLATLDTSVVPESGNLYYTAARVHATLGGTTTGGIPLANGSSFSLAILPACNGSGDKLLSTTSGFTCGVDGGGGGGGSVASVFGRTGTVVAASGDYAVAQITGAAPLASPALSGTPTAPTAAPGTNSTQLATTAFVAALAALKADLASPTFSGAPRVPTATPGTNSTIAASTAYADAIAALKANIASPALTGDPTAPTAGPSDSDTSIATTAMVQSAIDNKTLAGAGTADAYKLGGMSADGITARLKLYSMMPPIVFDAGASVLTASCVAREALAGGVFTGVHLLSIDSATGADISGSVTVQFATSPATGSTTWTNIGTVALSSASRLADTTLSGWTTTVDINRLVRVCITGSPTSVQKLIVSPRFF